MSRKERPLRRITGLNPDRIIERVGQRQDKVRREILRKIEQATELTPQEEILEREDDISMLIRNERQYATAVGHTRSELMLWRMLKSWGMPDEELRTLLPDPNKPTAQIFRRSMTRIGQLTKRSRERERLFSVAGDALIKAPRFYKDELDILIDENPHLTEGISFLDITEEQLRSKEETLALIRLQIDFLKEKQRRERTQKIRAEKEQKKVRQQKLEAQVETPVTELQSVASEEKPLTGEPEQFGLSDWRVWWTDTKFSDNPNHLIEMPTDSREDFLLRLEEINTGKRAFQIKTSSVANCVEMWGIPEFRQRAQSSRFRWGPDYVRDWAKLVRGPVRIMMNSNEETKRLIFFAADRDTVYRNVFAGMSS